MRKHITQKRTSAPSKTSAAEQQFPLRTRLVVSTLVAFSVFSSPAFAENKCAGIFSNDSQSSTKTELTTAERADFLKNYLFLNLSFPQHQETILAGLTAHVFANKLFEVKIKQFNDEEWAVLFKAMTHAHKAHGIRREVDMDLLKQTLSGFTRTELVDSVQNMFVFSVFPQVTLFPRTMSLAEFHQIQRHLFESRPDLIEKVARYSQTVLEALKSPEAREISNQFRDRARDGSSLRPYTHAAARSVREVVAKHLIAKHPELGASIKTVSPNSRWELIEFTTIAEVFYDVLSGNLNY